MNTNNTCGSEVDWLMLSDFCVDWLCNSLKLSVWLNNAYKCRMIRTSGDQPQEKEEIANIKVDQAFFVLKLWHCGPPLQDRIHINTGLNDQCRVRLCDSLQREKRSTEFLMANKCFGRLVFSQQFASTNFYWFSTSHLQKPINSLENYQHCQGKWEAPKHSYTCNWEGT